MFSQLVKATSNYSKMTFIFIFLVDNYEITSAQTNRIMNNQSLRHCKITTNNIKRNLTTIADPWYFW